MGNQENGPDSPDRGEIQALMCNEVLRDWLRHLETQSGPGRQLPAETESRHQSGSMPR